MRSIVAGQSALYVLAAVALLLTVMRATPRDPRQVADLRRVFLAGVACQCIHMIEELLTGFHVLLPAVFGQAPWSVEFFVTFNVIWIAIWVLAAAGVERRPRLALFPIWFFALGMVGNGIWHPLLALLRQGYFPGLFTSPLVGIAGVVVMRRLLAATTR